MAQWKGSVQCRDGWKALMLEQGFDPALCVGEADRSLPSLLCRQSVVLGVSDGHIMARPPPTKPAQLRATMPPIPQQLLDSFQDLPLRNDLPTGEKILKILTNLNVPRWVFLAEEVSRGVYVSPLEKCMIPGAL